MTAETTWPKCPDCKGTGMAMAGDYPTDGMFVTEIPGELKFFEWHVDDKPVAGVLAVIRGVMSKDEKYIVIQIWQMNTKKEHRRKGYMTSLITHMKTCLAGNVKYIITNYYDSTKEGRALLKKLGFEHKDVLLVWRREEYAKGNGEKTES